MSYRAIAPEATVEADLERCWVDWMTQLGNDPAIGRGHRLAEVLTAAGFVIDAEQHRVDELAVERSPAWTATTMMLASGHATRSDVARWEAAIAHRLRGGRLLDCQLPVTVVVAHPAGAAPAQ